MHLLALHRMSAPSVCAALCGYFCCHEQPLRSPAALSFLRAVPRCVSEKQERESESGEGGDFNTPFCSPLSLPRSLALLPLRHVFGAVPMRTVAGDARMPCQFTAAADHTSIFVSPTFSFLFLGDGRRDVSSIFLFNFFSSFCFHVSRMGALGVRRIYTEAAAGAGTGASQAYEPLETHASPRAVCLWWASSVPRTEHTHFTLSWSGNHPILPHHSTTLYSVCEQHWAIEQMQLQAGGFLVFAAASSSFPYFLFSFASNICSFFCFFGPFPSYNFFYSCRHLLFCSASFPILPSPSPFPPCVPLGSTGFFWGGAFAFAGIFKPAQVDGTAS